MSELDRHLTTEELSALLDNQLSMGEPEENMYHAHLQSCEQCQLEFAELRQTVKLLRSLPAPTLPRSFALPADISWEVPEVDEEPATPQEDAVASSPISLPQRRLQQARRTSTGRDWRPTLRLISSLVAVVGICFMLSTLQLPHFGGSATGTSSNSAMSRPSATNPPGGHATSSTTNTTHPPASGTVPGAKPSTAQSTTAQPNTTQSDPLQFLHFFGIDNSPGRLRLGLLLVIVGALGFYIFKQKYRHRWR
ncbi:anti-sigma factor family protein [Dictyobacter formicarum]|uniref:Zinc-finger domain-containing protein n=1 Tax=Dictyobacter formicarum TaxID=2778368 RepID=A0ABQ3VBV6_9CHLR|nr:hypothetical protein [Dictyobacter formicarum]GHO83519.1 hypothetical protein KSZ_15250 [Dictyobacter formicarum]